MSGYALHPEVFDDLAAIADYITTNGSPDAAIRVVDEILDAIADLILFPHRGHHRPDLTALAVLGGL